MLLAGLVFTASCERNDRESPLEQNTDKTPVAEPAKSLASEPSHNTSIVLPGDRKTGLQSPVMHPGNQFEIGNTRYLFVLNEHSIEEMHALLLRADEISRSSPAEFDELQIAMVIHGPTVNLFSRNNHARSSEVIDLAEKLDAMNVINFKICETSLSIEGVNRDEIPAFIQSVPFAPDEIARLKGAGYLNL